jgi:hypothetical protein
MPRSAGAGSTNGVYTVRQSTAAECEHAQLADAASRNPPTAEEEKAQLEADEAYSRDRRRATTPLSH